MTISRSASRILVTALVLAACSSARAREQTLPVALVPLAATGKGAAKVAAKATAAIAKQLRHQQGVRLVTMSGGRAERLHQCLQVASCIQGVANRLGASLLLTGYVTLLEEEGTFHVDLRIIAASGEVLGNDSFETPSPAGATGPATRSATRLVDEGKQRASKPGAAGGGGTSSGDPLFSRSEAQSAAAIVAERDKENPLEPPKPAPQATTAVVVKPQPRYRPHVFSRRYLTAWSVGVGGLVGLSVAIGFGSISRDANEAAQKAPYHKEAWLNHDKAQKNALVANILFGAGGAAVLTSALLFYLECRKDIDEQRRAQAGISLGFHVAHEGGTFTIRGAF